MIDYLTTKKTARVVIEGSDHPDLKNIWLITHGYGYLAPYFIKKFKTLFGPENLIIVPEALHRFYLNGVSEKIGASWMTSEEREKEVEDNNNYLEKVAEKYIQPIRKKICLNVLGFSQGASVACRWALTTKYQISNLIIWGSNIPPELSKSRMEEVHPGFNWIYVVGDKDEFISPEKQQEQIRLMRELGINPELLLYKGFHDINDEALRLLTQKCVKKT
jgi:predicted esterase